MELAVDGGYVIVTVGQLADVCAARKDGLISFLALRTWLAAHEQRAKRCTAKGRVQFTTAELARLIRAPELSVLKALRRLAALGLISWTAERIEFPQTVLDFAEDLAAELGTSPKRPVPIPRFVLRTLFRHKRPSEVMAAIAHLIRCLFRRGRQIFNYGLIKASWVATVFGVAERFVHTARRWLIEQGFLIQERVNQFVLNRWGAKFLVNLKQVKRPKPARIARLDSAPPRIKDCTSTNLSTSNYQKNYKPADGGQKPGVQAEPLQEPTLKNILPEDLRKLPRLEALYAQAVAANWLEASEANFRNFACAALRATRTGGRVGAIFVGIVKRRLWHYVTQQQEDHALGVLRRYRERTLLRAATEAESATKGLTSVKEVVGTVLNCAKALSGSGESPIVAPAARPSCENRL